MRSRKREVVFVGIGVLAGLALSGPAAQAADYLTAKPTTQTFYVDGQQVQFEAYQIHGNNFVKLRDIGKAVDFGVTYDAVTNSVYIGSTQHYQEESPPTASTLSEEAVRETILELKKSIPMVRNTQHPTVLRLSTAPTPTVTTAQAGPCCARTPPSAACRGDGWTTPGGRTSGQAT